MYEDNRVQLLGYLLDDPIVTEDNVSFHIRTTRMEIDGYFGRAYEDLYIYYEEEGEIRDKMISLRKYEFVNIIGEWDIYGIQMTSYCPFCGEMNRIPESTDIIYVKMIRKVNTSRDQDGPIQDQYIPEDILSRHYMEFSNQAMLGCEVIAEPQLITENERFTHCEYMIRMDELYMYDVDTETFEGRKVLTWGEQAEWDLEHLKPGTELSIYGCIRSGEEKKQCTCAHCSHDYVYKKHSFSVVPYRVNYVNDYNFTRGQMPALDEGEEGDE